MPLSRVPTRRALIKLRHLFGSGLWKHGKPQTKALRREAHMTLYQWIGMLSVVLIFAFIVFAFGQGFKVKHLEKVWPRRWRH
jgi:hypothetical protein